METIASLWDEIIGQEDVVTHLRRAIQDQSLSHAYLFVGPEGIGKSKVAYTFTAALNCEAGGCGHCSSCQRFLHGTHADLLVIKPEGIEIRIDQIRKEVLPKSVLKPIDARYKVFIIQEADALNEEAANALLKSLEEPPADLIYILLTNHPEKLPLTIVSRCQLVRFKPVSTAQLEQILIEKRKLGREEARLVARLSQGVLGEALRLIEDEWKLKRRERVLDVLAKLAKLELEELLEEARKLLDEAKKGVDDIKEKQKQEHKEIEELAVNPSHMAHWEKELQKKHKRQLNREENEGLEQVLSICASWFRDCLMIKESNTGGLLANPDRAADIKCFSEGLESDKILSCLETVEQTRQKTRYNINLQLALEVMLIRLNEEIGCLSL